MWNAGHVGGSTISLATPKHRAASFVPKMSVSRTACTILHSSSARNTLTSNARPCESVKMRSTDVDEDPKQSRQRVPAVHQFCTGWTWTWLMSYTNNVAAKMLLSSADVNSFTLLVSCATNLSLTKAFARWPSFVQTHGIPVAFNFKLVNQNTSTELHGRLALNTWSSTFPWKHQTSLSGRAAMQLLRQKNLVQICTHFSARHSSSTMRKTVVDRKQSFKNVSWNTLNMPCITWQSRIAENIDCFETQNNQKLTGNVGRSRNARWFKIVTLSSIKQRIIHFVLQCFGNILRNFLGKTIPQFQLSHKLIFSLGASSTQWFASCTGTLLGFEFLISMSASTSDNIYSEPTFLLDLLSPPTQMLQHLEQ